MTTTPAWRGLLPTLDTVGYRGDPAVLKAGPTRITAAGTLVENADYRGLTVVVDAPGVTFRNCLFDSRGPDWAAIRVSSTDLTVEDCTFDGGKRPSNHAGMIANPLNWKTGKLGGAWTIRRCVFRASGADTLHGIAGGLVEDCVFYGGGYSPGAHYDVIYSNHLIEPLTIRRNLFDMRGEGGQPGNPGNNCIRIMCAPSEGPLGSDSKKGVLIERNLLLGNGLGAYLIHILKGVENVIVVDNLSDESRYGLLYRVDSGQVIRWAGNYNVTTGKEIVPRGVTRVDGQDPPEPEPDPETPPPPPGPEAAVVSVVATADGDHLITLKVRFPPR